MNKSYKVVTSHLKKASLGPLNICPLSSSEIRLTVSLETGGPWDAWPTKWPLADHLSLDQNKKDSAARSSVNFLYIILIDTEPSYKEIKDQPLKELIQKLLVKDPQSRLVNALQIAELSFFKDFNWEALRRKELKPPANPSQMDPKS